MSTDESATVVTANDDDRYEASREATLKEAKERMRERAAEGYYPVSQAGGPPAVTATEHIED